MCVSGLDDERMVKPRDVLWRVWVRCDKSQSLPALAIRDLLRSAWVQPSDCFDLDMAAPRFQRPRRWKPYTHEGNFDS